MFYTLHYTDGSTLTIAIDAIESIIIDEDFCAIVCRGSDDGIDVERDEAMKLREFVEQLR